MDSGIKSTVRWLVTSLLLTSIVSTAAFAQTPATATKKKKSKYRPFSEVTEGAKRYDGLFRMYEVDDHLYAEIRPSQFKQMYLAPITIARGLASAGTPLNFGDEWILSFRREGDRVLLIRNNIHYEVKKGTPIGRAATTLPRGTRGPSSTTSSGSPSPPSSRGSRVRGTIP